MQRSIKFTKTVFFVPSRRTCGGLITVLRLSPASSGLFSRKMLKTLPRSCPCQNWKEKDLSVCIPQELQNKKQGLMTKDKKHSNYLWRDSCRVTCIETKKKGGAEVCNSRPKHLHQTKEPMDRQTHKNFRERANKLHCMRLPKPKALRGVRYTQKEAISIFETVTSTSQGSEPHNLRQMANK